MNRIKPATRRMLSVEVLRGERTSPHFVQLTVGGEDLTDFHPLGGDQAFRLMFRRPGQDRLWLPSASTSAWAAQYLLTSKTVRPFARFYTVRALRPSQGELDILFALHDEDSPAGAWVRRAKQGEPVGLFDEGATYAPDPGVDWQLLVGDESALPAVLSILGTGTATATATATASDREGLRSEVFLEVPSSADIQKLDTAPNVTVHWLPRDERPDARHGVPGCRTLEAVQQATLPPGRFATFVAGENGLPTALRRHLIADRGAAKSDISFIGYWRHGKASPG